MKEKILIKLDVLIEEANTLFSRLNVEDFEDAVDNAKFSGFQTGVLSFFKVVLGVESLYYKRFYNGVKYYSDYNLNLALELLRKVKTDITEGWFDDLKGLVSAELFTDFLDMAEHLLEEGYKDPAAVIIGSVL